MCAYALGCLLSFSPSHTLAVCVLVKVRGSFVVLEPSGGYWHIKEVKN